MSVSKHTNAVIYYNRTYTYTAENNIYLDMFRAILDRRLFESMRERAGGTYGVRVDVNYNSIPNSSAGFSMLFDSDPDKGDLLHQIINQEVSSLVELGVTEEEFNNAMELLRNDREQNMKKNSYWLGAIKEYALIAMEQLLKTNFEEVLKNVDAVKLNTFIREFVSDTNTYEVIMKPKE